MSDIPEPWSVWKLPDGECELHGEDGELLLSVEGEQRAQLERVKDLYNALLIDAARNLSPDAPRPTGSSVAPPKSESAASAATPKENQ